MKDKTDKTLQFSSYLAPRHWPLWSAIGLLWLVAQLPMPLVNALGNLLGLSIYHLVPSRRRVARINLKQAFPQLGAAEIKQLNKNAFKSLGISIFEMGFAWFKKSSVLKQQCQIEGKEHLDQAMAKNKSVILLTGHFTTLEIGGRLFGFYIKGYNGVFKKAHDPLFNAIMVHYRSKFGNELSDNNELIDNKNVRSIIRGLKKGHVTWFAPDQDFSDQDIVFTPFLGGIASTLTATAKMAKIAGAAVVPFYPVRLPSGKGYKLMVLPPLENFPSGDIEADSARVNKVIEDMIYSCPEQYLWSHKRFKTSPTGRSNIYTA